MTDKEMVGVRLPADTLRRVEQYAEDHDLSKSDALRRMIQKGVELEDAGIAVAAATVQDETEEKEIRTDGSGGVVREAFFKNATILLSASLVSWILSFTSVVSPPQVLSLGLACLTVALPLIALTYTSIPERIEKFIRSKNSEVNSRVVPE
jgi:predicted DNA-binding protein